MKKRPLIGVTGIYARQGVSTLYPHPQEYCQAVHDFGGIPVTIPAFLTKEESLRYLEYVDAMIFIGGPDIPSHLYGEEPLTEYCTFLPEKIAEAHLALVSQVQQSDMPFIGVCLGCQELNVGSGGKLIQHLYDLTSRHRNTYVDQDTNKRPDTYHFVEVAENSLLEELFGSRRIRVNSCHHQAVDPDYVSKCRITARSTEDNVVEAIEFSDRQFGLGVQWHPERIDDWDHRKRIFEGLIAAAQKFHS